MTHTDLDLLQTYLDGDLSADQEAAVEARLRGEPALADALVRLSREEAILTEWGSAAVAAAIPFAIPVQAMRNRRRFLAIGGSVAAAVLLFGLFALSRPGKEHFRTVAKLEDVQGEVFIVPETGEPYPARSGESVRYGQGLRTQGEGSYAVLAYPDASRLELGADTSIRMQKQEKPGKKVHLEQGIVAAEVARQPDDWPMIVTTPHAVARIHENRSSFASAAGETRIESEKGKIQLTRKSDGRSIDVPTGWYAVAAEANDSFAPKELPKQVTVPRAVLPEMGGPVACAVYSPDSLALAVGCHDGTIKLYDANSFALRQVIAAHKRPVKALTYARVGNLLASGADDRVVKLWDATTGAELHQLKGYKHCVDALAFSPNGGLLATGGGASKMAELRLWDMATRGEIQLPKEHANAITAVAFSSDGRTLASAGKDNLVKLYDVEKREVRHTLTGHGRHVNTLAFQPFGKLLATGGKDRSVKLWDATTGKEQKTLQGQACEVRSLAFSPDGRLLAAADHNVTLYDVATGRERMSFKGHRHAIGSVRFSPNGRFLATAGFDKTVRVWDATGGDDKPRAAP